MLKYCKKYYNHIKRIAKAILKNDYENNSSTVNISALKIIHKVTFLPLNFKNKPKFDGFFSIRDNIYIFKYKNIGDFYVSLINKSLLNNNICENISFKCSIHLLE